MPRPELFQEHDDGITEKEEEPIAMETEAEPTSYQLLSGMHNKCNAMHTFVAVPTDSILPCARKGSHRLIIA